MNPNPLGSIVGCRGTIVSGSDSPDHFPDGGEFAARRHIGRRPKVSWEVWKGGGSRRTQTWRLVQSNQGSHLLSSWECPDSSNHREGASGQGRARCGSHWFWAIIAIRLLVVLNAFLCETYTWHIFCLIYSYITIYIYLPRKRNNSSHIYEGFLRFTPSFPGFPGLCFPSSEDCICDGGIMAAPGFDWKSLYAELKRAFLDLAAEVQQGLRDKTETQELGDLGRCRLVCWRFQTL